MSTISFTVVIPVHNGANYIAEALESILKQTYPPARILILENQSSDHTLAVVARFQDSRIRVIPAPTLLTIEENWARILDLPLTEFFTFIGHDDLLYPEFFAHMATLIACEPNASLYQAGVIEVDSAGQLIRHLPAVPAHSTANEFLSAVIDERETICGTGYVIRAEEYRRVGGIPQFVNLLYADVVLWYRLTALSYRAYTPLPLAGYRIHDQNTHQQINPMIYYKALCNYTEFLRTSGLYADHADKIERYSSDLFQRVYRRAAREAAFGDDPERLNRLTSVIARANAEGTYPLTDAITRLYLNFADSPAPMKRAVRGVIDGLSALKRTILALKKT